MTNILHQLTATSNPLNKGRLRLQPVGNRTSLTDRRGVQAFGYDQLDRLTADSHPLLLNPQAFAYDAMGCRTKNGSVTNAGNQLTADSNFTYQYDNGNLTRKTLLTTGNYTQSTYDVGNFLTQVQEFAAGNPTAITTSTYRYDGLGRRIEKVANGQTTRYIYDSENILLEYDGANVLQARYTHGPGIDKPIAVTKGASTFFYHRYGLGSVTELTDSTGSVAKAYAYDAYGNMLESAGTIEQPYTYTGRELDSETGLYYYRARYYDAMTGRFLQKDPIGFGGGINPYRYGLGNPINLIDQFGLSCDWSWAGRDREYSEDTKTLVLREWEFAAPTGVVAGPDYDNKSPRGRRPPMKPQMQFDWWKFKATLRNIIVTAIWRDITHYFYVCEDETVGPCGQRETIRYSGTYDDVNETRGVISDTYDLMTERLYRIGAFGGIP